MFLPIVSDVFLNVSLICILKEPVRESTGRHRAFEQEHTLLGSTGTPSSRFGAEALGESREVEAQFPPEAWPGPRTLQQSMCWTSVFATSLTGIFVQCTKCTTMHSSPALSDYSLGKRADERAINFARHPFSNHICIHLFLQTQDLFGGWRGEIFQLYRESILCF